MKQMFFWKFALLSSLTQLAYTSHLSAEVTLPLSGTHAGEDLELFTMLTTSPQGTNYTLRGEFTLKDFLGNNIHKSGGAFCNSEGNLTFTGSSPLAILNFTNLQLGGQGAGVFSKTLLTFENLKAINVENNQSSGGVFTSKQDMLFTRNTSLLFQNNISHGAGGAILLTGVQPNHMRFSEQRGAISFIKNRAQVTKNITNSGNGGAINSEVAGSSILFDGNQEILFQENYANFGGGICNAQGTVEFNGNKNTITFTQNRAVSSGGAIFTKCCNIHKQTAPVVFCKNSADILGGAIFSSQVIIKNNDAPILFSENHAKGGGAIAAVSCNITASQPIIFSDNSSRDFEGGAIYLSGQPKLHLHAQSADIIFSNNTARITTKHSSTIKNNAIIINGAPESIRLIANENQSIIFYDPVLAASQGADPIHINSVDHTLHCGSVIFSGEKLAIDRQDNNNKTSIFNQPVYLHNGTLSIISGAILAVQEFKQLGGTLHLSPGSMLTTYNSSGKDLVISNISFGLDTTHSHLPAEIRSGNSVIKLSGSPQIHDPDNIFYNNHDLASQPYHMEIVFKSEKSVNIDNFIPEEIAVQQNAYGYQGVWKFNWSKENSKRHKTLKASWIPTGTFILNPEKEGYLIPSSVWATFTGMRSSNDAILDNYLNNNTIMPIKYACIFGGPISSVMEQNGKSYNNFSTTQVGQNVGIKLPFSPNTVVCATFTQLHGSISQDNIPGKSNSHMLLGTVAAFKNWRALSFRSSISYAEESHVAKHQFSKKDITRGAWKNQGFRGSVGLSYAYPKGIRCLKITPFVDLEYTVINQNPFIETGYDPRYFASSHLSNLALPTGVSLELRLFGAKYSLFTQLSMAYIKDLLRENPTTTAALILNQHSWKVAGAFIGQEAVNLKFRSTLKYRFATAYLGISTTQREGNNLSGDAFGGLSLSF
ncbi:polymorphic outer membrane protein middle domain-containing protein [Chlamydia caviae]|uniref:Polymorphic outer membrane protein A family protein/autotransporter, putative n=1 Tax=Chlamydia caviae (strain ATCC VR-813 / DSM 19441 / 03DC25 / GPIC) TaxID=227941 RepID=Q824E6_CHLCV|nr:polymorphic outer membrane protein middle domain-containing protein [Chlamydia caviae]AAP04957.1 polymorphic outer membrane protein A family protein/autotransporter, putative [Chlamydia caviae GPIC]